MSGLENKMLKQKLTEAQNKISIEIDDNLVFELYIEEEYKTYIIVDNEWFDEYENKIKERTRIIFDTVTTLLQNDFHELGSREECRTCNHISELIGKPFGCKIEYPKSTPSQTPSNNI
jgi:hypothetical protein